MLATITGALAAACGFIAAYWWYKASAAQVLSQSLGGWGAMLGGELVVRGVKGERLNFMETFVLQTRLNMRAAAASGVASLIGGISVLLNALKL